MTSERQQSDEELVTYATSKLTTSRKVSFWDTFAEPEIPQELAAKGVVADYNTGQLADGDVSAARPRPASRPRCSRASTGRTCR